LGGKWLQLLKEIAPGITAAAIITSPLSPLALNDRSRAVGYMPAVEDAARSMGISVSVVEISNPIEIEEKISGLKPHQGVIFPPNSFIAAHRARIIELLTRFRVPGVYFARSSFPTAVSSPIESISRTCSGKVAALSIESCGGRSPPTYRRNRRQVRVGDQSQDRQSARPHRP
jgi:hypothetical protein